MMIYHFNELSVQHNKRGVIAKRTAQMRINCPNCKAEQVVETDRFVRGLVTCWKCNFSISRSQLVEILSDFPGTLSPRPKGAYYFRDVRSEIIGVRVFSLRFAFMALGFLIFFTLPFYHLFLVKDNLGEYAYLGTIGLILGFILDSVLTILFLYTLFGKIEVRWYGNYGELFRGIRKLGITTAIRWNQINEIGEFELNYSSDRLTGILIKSLDVQKLGEYLSDPKREYLYAGITYLKDKATIGAHDTSSVGSAAE